MEEGFDYNIDIFYADRKEGKSAFLLKTNIKLLQKLVRHDCHENCKTCSVSSDRFSCVSCHPGQHRIFNQATSECTCKVGYAEPKGKNAGGKCVKHNFAAVMLDTFEMKKSICMDMCEVKTKQAQSTEFVLRITTKEGAVPALLDSEDWDHPRICGQYHAIAKSNSIEYIDGPECQTTVQEVSSRRMNIKIKFGAEVENPFSKLMAL